MNSFPTSDFQIAVVLSALGFRLVAVDKSKPRFIFHFEDNPNISDFVKKFYQGQLSIDPRLTLLHSKLLKDRIHGGEF